MVEAYTVDISADVGVLKFVGDDNMIDAGWSV
jgi:hypothetical protein